MLSKLSIGLLALASLFGLSKPADAQGYWYGPGYYSPYYPYSVYPNYGYRYPMYNPYYSPGLGIGGFGFHGGYGHSFGFHGGGEFHGGGGRR